MKKKNTDYSTNNVPMVGNIPPKMEDGDISNKAFIISNKKDKSNRGIIILIIVICLVVICGAIYFYFANKK